MSSPPPVQDNEASRSHSRFFPLDGKVCASWRRLDWKASREAEKVVVLPVSQTGHAHVGREFFFFFNIWPHQVLVLAHRIFVEACRICVVAAGRVFRCGM